MKSNLRFVKNLSGLFLTVILLPLFSAAQSNYQPGYIVNLKGDTLRGFIDYKEWGKTPDKFNFKGRLQEKEPEKFSVENALAFGINGVEYYEQYKLSISTGKVDDDWISAVPDTGTMVSTVFLKRVTKGKNADLYEYEDNIKLRFFIKDQQSVKPEELIYRTYRNPDNNSQVVKQPRYQNQLQQMAAKYGVGSEKLTRNIERSEYNETDILNIVRAINGTESQDDHAQKASPIRFFLGIGVSENSLKYSGDTYLSVNATSKANYGPKFDAGLDVFLNPNVGRLILRAELSFTNANLQVTSHTTPNASQSFGQFAAAFTPQLIYNFYNSQNVKVYAGAGASIAFTKNSNNNYSYDSDPYSGLRTVMKNYPNLASSYVSLLGRVGLVLNKKYELYACYLPSAVVTDHYGAFSGSITSFQAGFNYLLGPK